MLYPAKIPSFEVATGEAQHDQQCSALLRRRRAKKTVHFDLLRKRIYPTKVTPPTIVNHTKPKVLSMKFIPSFKLYNKAINRYLPDD
jgi:hypothetical protein